MNELQTTSNEPLPQALDKPLHTQMARFTHGVSPASLAGAYLDWLTHLALSPGKQQELLRKAVEKRSAYRLACLARAA